MSIERFEYSAITSAGERTTGQIEASGEHDAYRRLSAKGMTPITISRRRTRSSLFSFGRVSATDIANLTRELAVLLDARIPLARGLASIAEQQSKPELTTIIRDVAAAIESGLPMTEALRRHEAVFGEVYIETIRAAERSGNLAEVVSHLAELLDRQIEARQQLRRALTYPVIVLAVVAIAMTVIFVFVVPRFAATFEQQGVKLPLVTRMVHGFGMSVREYWFVYAGLIVGSLGSLIAAWASETWRPALERFLIRVPYIGRLLLADTASRFARVMSISLSSGLGVIESLEIAGRAAGVRALKAETAEMADKLRGGLHLSDVLKSSLFIPSFARRMLAAGRDSGEVSRACLIVGKHYERESTHLTKNINTIIEPILTVVLAGIVLVVALSVFIPMWEMVRISR